MYSNNKDLVEWLASLAINGNVATVLGSIPASSDTAWNLSGAADEAVLNNYIKT